MTTSSSVNVCTCARTWHVPFGDQNQKVQPLQDSGYESFRALAERIHEHSQQERCRLVERQELIHSGSIPPRALQQERYRFEMASRCTVPWNVLQCFLETSYCGRGNESIQHKDPIFAEVWADYERELSGCMYGSHKRRKLNRDAKVEEASGTVDPAKHQISNCSYNGPAMALQNAGSAQSSEEHASSALEHNTVSHVGGTRHSTVDPGIPPAQCTDIPERKGHIDVIVRNSNLQRQAPTHGKKKENRGMIVTTAPNLPGYERPVESMTCHEIYDILAAHNWKTSESVYTHKL